MTAQAQAESAAVGPIVLYASKGFDSYTFSLDLDSRDLLLDQAPVPSTLPRRVTIALDLAQPFEAAFGSVYRHVIPLLTNQEVGDLLRLGGVEVRDPKTDQVLWRAP